MLYFLGPVLRDRLFPFTLTCGDKKCPGLSGAGKKETCGQVSGQNLWYRLIKTFLGLMLYDVKDFVKSSLSTRV